MSDIITRLIRPVVEPHLVTSPYGQRMLPDGKGGYVPNFHDGIDYVSQTNDWSVLAICDGTVWYDEDYYDHAKRWTDARHSAGNWVGLTHWIHGQKYYARYMHLEKNYVNKGDTYPQGFTIGTFADVGQSYGAHLHFDLFDERWVKLDPTSILVKGMNIQG